MNSVVIRGCVKQVTAGFIDLQIVQCAACAKSKPLSLKAMKKVMGFTLIELMITIAVAVIIMTLAVPSMRIIIMNNRVTAHSNSFLSSMVTARSEAIKRNQQVKITAINPTAANEWGNAGWRIWVDINGNGTFDAAADTVIRQVAGISNTFVIDAATNDVTEVNFQANGSASASDTFDVKIASGCPGTTDKAIRGKKINVSATGRASSVTCSCDSSASDPC